MGITLDWSIIIGIIGGIGIPLFIALVIQSRKKSLSYAFTDSPVFTIKEKIKNVEVTWSSIPVKSLRLVMVKIRNSGNIPILENDYSTPISFCPTFDNVNPTTGFLTFGEIISAPESSNPEFIVYEVNKHSHRLALKNILLNPKDSIILKILIVDFGGNNPPINVTGRIEGIVEFKKEALVLDESNPIMRFIFVPNEKMKVKKGQSTI